MIPYNLFHHIFISLCKLDWYIWLVFAARNSHPKPWSLSICIYVCNKGFVFLSRKLKWFLSLSFHKILYLFELLTFNCRNCFQFSVCLYIQWIEERLLLSLYFLPFIPWKLNQKSANNFTFFFFILLVSTSMPSNFQRKNKTNKQEIIWKHKNPPYIWWNGNNLEYEKRNVEFFFFGVYEERRPHTLSQ